MEGLALGLLAAASFGILMTKKRREGFLVSNDAAALFGNQRTANVESGAKKYNPLMSLMSPGNNPLLNPGYTPDDIQDVQHAIRGALGGAIAKPVDPSFNYKQSYTSDLQLNPASKGTAINTMKMCESVKTIDCSKFDNPEFKESCGICFEDGKNSSGMPSIGGLYVSADDKDNAIHNAKKMGSNRVNHMPSIGSCKTKRFVTTKEECIRLEKQFECEKKQNFEVPGCSQCFQDGIFQYLDSDSVTKNTAILVLAGNGNVSVTKVATQELVNITLSATPSNINLSSLMEGDQIQLDFKTADSYVAGYISGTTASGSFNMDIVPITPTDLVTNSNPRLTGSLDVNDASYTVIRPGIGKKSMSLVITNPFTFVSVNQDEAALCASSPYIATEKSARLLQSSPCYAKGQRPGNYSKECVQSVFDSAGCTSSGTAYPYNEANTKAVSYDKNGKPLSVGGIANLVYSMYNAAMLGQDANGQPLEINDWDKASMACLGTHKTSVCDKYDKINGPLGADCLNYLWLNSGASDQLPFGIGSTYTGSTNSASLQAKRGNRFCTSGGSLAPMDEKGNVNQAAVAQAQAKGGVASVTQFYDTISKKANDNAITDEVRKPFIEQCYGVSITSVEKPKMLTTYVKTTGGYNEACAPGPCFEGLTVAQVQEQCSNDPQCVGFSYSESTGGGCIKTDADCGFRPSNVHNGYTKSDKAPYKNVIDNKPGRTKSAFVPPPPPTTRCPTSIDDNLDRPNADLYSFLMERDDPLICQQKCVDDPNCKAWACSKTTTECGGEKYARCWIKGVGYGNAESKCRVSGIVEIVPGQTCTPLPPLPPPPPPKKINIIQASYGKNCNGNLTGNRTQLLKNLANNKNSFNYIYDYKQTGGDPAYGCAKTLEIIYDCGDGQNKIFIVPPEAGVGGKVSIGC
jgi:hypothetical protein